MATLQLKDILKKKKLSHNQFSKLMKMHRGTLSRYLRSGANPTLSTLTKFARILDVKVRDLLRE